MSSAAVTLPRAIARARPEYTANSSAGGEVTPLALGRFNLVAARRELDCAHRAFQRHPSRSTLQRLLHAICRHRELIGGTS
jgi:hypothetical protein